MHGEFALKIKLGNDAMQYGGDICGALRKVGQTVLDTWNGKDDDRGAILDGNGSRVGNWELTVEK